jgi:hypothetical protein
LDGEGSLKQKENLNSDEIANVKQLREILESGELTADVLREAEKLEGSVRGTGVHAAGIIIAPSDLTEIIPVCTSKESTLLLTQYDGKVIEDAGVIKMDFLGLKTLTIIRDALRMIDANHGIRIDIDGIPLDDPKTYALYQRADERHLPVRKRGHAEVLARAEGRPFRRPHRHERAVPAGSAWNTSPPSSSGSTVWRRSPTTSRRWRSC